MARVVYSPHYDMGLFGFERLHPFDVRKFGKAFAVLRERFGPRLDEWCIPVDRPVTYEELKLVHSREYLASLRDSKSLAQIFEVPAAAMLPAMLIDRGILTPMRWACRGSVLAARAAIEHGVAVNLGGGFHHASRERGEGFCVYSDFALIQHQFRTGDQSPFDVITYIDTDAHQGNGVCHVVPQKDHRHRLFDVFNGEIYPQQDVAARERIDHAIPLPCFTSGGDYLRRLKDELPEFLDAPLPKSLNIEGIAIYNAGTDVLDGDEVGLLSLSPDDVVERDLFVIGELRRRNIPVVMLLSGGYSPQSYRVIAESVTTILERW